MISTLVAVLSLQQHQQQQQPSAQSSGERPERRWSENAIESGVFTMPPSSLRARHCIAISGPNESEMHRQSDDDAVSATRSHDNSNTISLHSIYSLRSNAIELCIELTQHHLSLALSLFRAASCLFQCKSSLQSTASYTNFISNTKINTICTAVDIRRLDSTCASNTYFCCSRAASY